MNFTRFLSSPRILITVGVGLLLSSCSTKVEGDGATIVKVNPFHLPDAMLAKPIVEPSLAFERQRVLHGALTMKEILARQGDYYTVFWKAKDRSQPVTVRLEYRQKATGLTLKTIDQEVTDVKRNNVTNFTIAGDDYATNGAVTMWRVSLVRGKTVLVSYNSYLWQ